MRRDARGRAWEAYFTTTTRLSGRIESELKQKCGLTLPEYNVLLQVYRAGTEGIRPSTLAQEVVFSPSRLTHTVTRLVGRGLLERSACAADGRGGIIHLTEEGDAFFKNAAEVQRAIVRTLVLDDLEEDDVEALNRIFLRIADRIDSKR